jgi:sugar transferase (PEP-CTERM/EpsH1 system associated)
MKPQSSPMSAARPFRLRILHVVSSFTTGGLEKGICSLIRNSSQEFEHIVLCLNSSGEMARQLPAGTSVVVMGKPPGNSPLFIWKLARQIKELKPDVVHTRNWSGVDGILAARIAGIRPVVHGEHGWSLEDPFGKNPRRKRIRQVADLMVCRYTCVAEHMVPWLTRVIGVRRPVTQIYNGVDCERYRPASDGEKALLRAKWGLPEGGFVIGIVGRLDPIKNHRLLFRAFRGIHSVRPDTRLLVVGNGPERSNLEKESSEGTVFLGNREEVPEILRMLDLFVLPSFNEGISNTILEAMATGLPVVASRVGGNPELVDDGRTGALFRSGDDKDLSMKIRFYLEHEDAAKTQATTGRNEAERRFSIPNMVAAYERVWREVWHQHTGQAR